MYIFILAVFLQMQPVTNVLFVQTYESKADCKEGEKLLKEQVPEDKQDSVACIQVVNQDKIKEI